VHKIHHNVQFLIACDTELSNLSKMRKRSLDAYKIALLIQGSRNYERELLSGIAEYGNLHGPWRFFRNVSYLPDDRVTPEALLRTWNPDAMIVREHSPRYYDKILKSKIPIVYGPTTEARSELTNIVVDDLEVGRKAAEHLYENGMRDFAFCGVSDLFFWSRLRKQGFCEQIEFYGHEVHVFESPTGDEFLSWHKRSRILRNWLAKLPTHTGLMACTDDFALLAQEACIAIGRSIPDDIAIIGVGNDESVCELAATPLSSVSLNIKRAGYDAAQFLANCLKKGASRNKSAKADIIIEPMEVVARRSTDPTETRDAEIAKAITFITEQINQPIEVSDVVDVVSLSRRALYDRFQAATGKAISSYIRQRRLEHFAKLLLETNLTIAEITYSMGYESDANVARLFKKHYGMTPLLYRRKHATK